MHHRAALVLALLASACGSELPEASGPVVASTSPSTSTVRTSLPPQVTTTVAEPEPSPPAPESTSAASVRLVRVRYGAAPQQVGDLRIPPGPGPFGVLVFIHGGFWRSGFDETLMSPLAIDATDRGVATWNFDYRSVGDPGGGFPGTLEDVAVAMDHLASLGEDLLLDDVTVIGHSAGGHLALWSASRHLLRPGDPGADPVVRPHTVVAQAAVADLRAAAVVNMGGRAVEGFLGGEPDEVPEHYRVAQPIFDGYRIVAVHGRYDQVVSIGQSKYLEGSTGIFDDTGTHFDVIDPGHELWQRTLREIGLVQTSDR